MTSLFNKYYAINNIFVVKQQILKNFYYDIDIIRFI